MNPAEQLSNLYALRQLYGLLQNGEDGLQHINSKNVGKGLDVRARQLLKDLLDDATEKIFNTHSEIIAAQAVVYSSPCSSQPEQPRALPKLNSPRSPATVNSALNTVLNYGKDSESCKISLKKDEQSPKKPQGEIPENKISILTDLPGHEKKQCRICLENNLKKHLSFKESKISNERAKVLGNKQHDWLSDLNGVDELAKRLQESNRKVIRRDIGIGDPSILGLGASSSTVSPTTGASVQKVRLYPIGMMKGKSNESSDYSKVVENAIKQIESHIFALHLSSSDLADSFNSDANEHGSYKLDASVSLTPSVKTEEQAVTTATKRELSGIGESWSLLGGTQLLTCPTSKVLSQKHESSTGNFASRRHDSSKAIMERFESSSQRVSQNHKMSSYVNGLRIPPTQDELAMKPPTHDKAPGQASQTSLVQNLTSGKKVIVISKPLMPSQSTGSKASPVGLRPCKKLSETRKREMRMQRHHQMIMRPVLFDEHKPRERTGTYKMSYVDKQHKRIPRKQQVLEEESSSSSTNSQTLSTYSSERPETRSSVSSNKYSEDYRSTSQSTRSTLDIDHMRSRRRSIKVAAKDRSSSRQDSSCCEEEEEENLYSHKRYPNKSIGRFRRLKNRLGLIFHHHHHHHHHHHRGNVNSHNGHGHSAWKHLRKMIIHDHKNKHGVNDHHGREREAGVRKSVVKHNNEPQQVGHFHALVEGLLKHVRHSKKSNKLSKGGGIGRLKNGRHHQSHRQGRLNNKNRLHWWHTFGRGGVKLPKATRGRIKVGFTTKRRPKLK